MVDSLQAFQILDGENAPRLCTQSSLGNLQAADGAAIFM
ncbi:predicted protein [Botrytis cinerea T4]|uniref:Uncharacterized protein n=1 Tax=Botryotinia fuckeliana (strain T4) TaxID=999810 RepID=G2Y2A8_BOTF4|nr:predicted protein [Botrytis cinerea T4]